MILRYPALRIVFIILISLCAYRAIGQPTLPDIAGAADKGVVVLSWNCQYSSVKSIAVLRSAESTGNYSVIGYVKNLDKGLQVFADGHPAPGGNCYKLIVIFKTGLNWGTNYVCVNVPHTAPGSAAKLPANDSLQKLIVTQDIPKPAKPAATVNETTKSAAAGNATAQSTQKQPEPPKVSVSFRDDATGANTAIPVQGSPSSTPRKKIVVSFQEPDEAASSLLIRSRYISTDPVSGNIIMELPDDVATHHYSIKFYDQKDNMVIEIPRINTQKIIIDKRNFQHKGIYKFRLRRDVVELDGGYISINQ